MSTREPRNGTPSASSRARWRGPLAGDPSARTTRCHGRSGSSQAWSTEPAKRGAPGETSPYDATNPGGIARTRRSTASVRFRTDAIVSHHTLPRCARRQPRSPPAVRQGPSSIAAPDPETGEVGVAVQSHWFSVGSIVSWARPGVGAVATQSIGEPSYGPGLLDLLAEGVEPSEALARLTSEDERAAFRQVAVVDAAGRVAVHTGQSCIAFAGDRTGDGYSVQANMMASPAVWPAMAEAFEASEGPLARRLLVALRAAEAAGGDARGRQSSAVVVAPAEGEPWRLSVDLRVEDHPEPLDEIERLLDMAEAYKLANSADTLAGQGRHEEASGLYRRAADLAPGSHELLFWSGLAAAQGGDMDTAVRRVREAIALQPGWTELLTRLEPDIAPSAAAVRAALRDGG